MSNRSFPRISNISATFNFNTKINIHYVKKKLEGLILKKFKAVKITTINPSSSSNIFENGKVVIAGVSSLEDLQEAILKVQNSLSSIGIICYPNNLKIQNFVASGNLNEKVDLVLTYNNIRSQNENILVSYEPELYPGLICKEQNAVFTVFTTGKYIITGCKNEQEIFNMFEKFFLLIIFKQIPMEIQ